MYKRICYVNTIYSLLFFLLIKPIEETFFILGEELPEEFKKNFKYPNISFKKEIIKGIGKRKKYYLKIKRNYLLNKALKNIDKKAVVYGYHMSDWISNLLKEKYKYIILEDGLANYNFKEKDIKKTKLNLKEWLMLGGLYNYPSYGLCDKSYSVYLSGLQEIPSKIKNKTKVLNLKNIWKMKTETEKEEILDIFNLTMKELSSIKLERVLLVTQPLSEDKIITEAEKVLIYEELIKEYGEENIILKTHPREKTRYKRLFPKIVEIKKGFPLELLALIDIELKEIVTLFSTSVFLFPKEKVRFIGTKKYPKILKKMGEIGYEKNNS